MWVVTVGRVTLSLVETSLDAPRQAPGEAEAGGVARSCPRRGLVRPRNRPALRHGRPVVQTLMSARSHSLVLSCQPESFGQRLQANLPPGAAGAWCRLRVTGPSGTAWWAKAELQDDARGQIVREVFLGPCRSAGGATHRETLVHVPQSASALTVLMFGGGPALASARLTILPRAHAALVLVRHGWRRLPHAIAGAPDGLPGRVRAVLGQAPARAGEAPPYTQWLSWFEPPPAQTGQHWNAEIVVGMGSPALTAFSEQSARQQNLPVRIIRTQADWQNIQAAWVIILQAGEILSPDAVSRFAQAAALAPFASCITADLDHLAPDGARHAPLFKPGPDPILLRSGLPAWGACAIRWRNVPLELPLRADQARQILACRCSEAMVHIPAILTHCAAGSPAPAIIPKANIKPASHASAPAVTVIVPSAGQARHVLRCLRAVIARTAYPLAAVRVILSSAGKPDILRGLARMPGVSVIRSKAASFNYAGANNEAASTVETEFMLLLNDDVTPIGPDWLHAMVAYMQDPKVGIVGARLLYGNGMVQHEGVIMGLANLCEHAGRLRQGSDPGLHGLGLADRQVSAVTGACLLIRTALYRELGGMDTAYAVALNDVDLCLRAREAGWRVVYCASAELVHYESLSLGRHYAGSRAALESHEVRRLRSRFAAVIASDPFYSPNASLQPGREWQPAFPPRPAGPILGTPPQSSNSLASG